MKRILILGGSHRDIPLIKASQELGYFVITLGDRDYYLGHSYADKYYHVNFNNFVKIKEIIEEEQIDYLIPGSGEEAYLNVVQLSEELNIGNFDTVETAKLVHNKWKFKEFCLSNAISTPYGFYYTDNSKLNDLKFPIVVKPTNLSGGRGVEIVNTLEELTSSLSKAKEISDEIFLEEFIDGELIAYSIIIKNRKIIYGFTGKDDTYKNKYLITSAYPIKIEETILLKLKNDIEQIAELLSLVDGMFHLQIIIKENIPYIIDVTRRIPGDFYPYLIEYCDNIEYSKTVIEAYIGKNIKDEFTKIDNQEFIIRHCVMSEKNGIYKKIQIDDSLKEHIILSFDLMEENIQIENFLTTQIAIVFIRLPYVNKNIIKNINKLIYPVVVNIKGSK